MSFRGSFRFAAGLAVLLLLVVWFAVDREEQSPDADIDLAVTSPPDQRNAGAFRPEHHTNPGPALSPGVASSASLGPIPARNAEARKREGVMNSPDGSLVLVQGIVLDADSETPVTGARLEAYTLQGLRRTAVTNPEGAFSFAVPRGTTFDLATTADGYVRESRSQIYVDANTHLSVRLEKERILRGLVIDQIGTPVKNADISFECQGESVAYSVSARKTGSDGTFEIRYRSGFNGPKSKPKECEIRASHPTARRPATATVTLPPTEEYVTLTLEIEEKETALIWGLVSDLDGRAVPGASVQMFQGLTPLVVESVLSDQEGIYRMPPTGPGTYSLTARNPDAYMVDLGMRKSITAADSGQYRIDLVADFSRTVEGRVLDASGNALPGTLIECVLESEGGASSLTVRADDEGHFVLTGLERRHRYQVSATHPDYQSSRMELRFPFPEFLELVLEEGLTLDGVVNDSRGMPLFGGVLSVSLPGQAGSLRSVSIEGTSGTFKIRGLPMGTLELRLRLPDGKTLTGTIELHSDRRILVLSDEELRVFPY